MAAQPNHFLEEDFSPLEGQQMIALALALLQMSQVFNALPAVPGLPPNISWGMSSSDVIELDRGAIHLPLPNSIESLMPPRGLHLGAQSENGDYTSAFYFSPMSNRLSAVLVTLKDDTRDASKCLPWLYEIRAVLGEAISSDTVRGTDTVMWVAGSSTVTFISSYPKKRTKCSVLLDSAGSLPPQ